MPGSARPRWWRIFSRHRAGRRSGIALDATDGDPAAFCAYLLEALRQHLPRKVATSAGRNLHMVTDWAAASQLLSVVQEYRGDLVADDPYEEWVVRARDRLARRYLDALAGVAEAEEQEGRWEATNTDLHGRARRRVRALSWPARMEVDEVRRLLVRWTAAVVLVFGLAGGAAASHTGLLFGASARVAITMTEYKFDPAVITVEAGKSVDLVFENKGVLPHVFMVYPGPKKTLKGAGEWWDYVLVNTYLKDMGEIMVHTRGEFVVAGTRVSEVGVEPGKKVTLTFTPGRKGTFEIGCHLSTGAASHYTAGMKAKLIVK